MIALLQAHLMLLCLWAGIVLAEGVIELLPLRRPIYRNAAVSMHLWIDVLIEFPVIVGVLLTGVLLLKGHPWDVRLVLKVGAGCAAILANLACMGIVIRRAWVQWRRRGPRRVLCLTRAIILSAAIGLPFAVASAILGFLLAG